MPLYFKHNSEQSATYKGDIIRLRKLPTTMWVSLL